MKGLALPVATALAAPEELWRLIFHVATASSLPRDVGHRPFQSLRDISETTTSLDEEARRLRTCLSITRVCKLWRFLVAEYLYEDVRIMGAAGLKSLVSGLQRSALEDGLGGFGRYIRRLEMPMRHTQSGIHVSPFEMALPSSSTFQLGDLFRLCPRLEIFCRPCLRLDSEGINFWASLIDTPLEGDTALLPHLRRLEWSAALPHYFRQLTKMKIPRYVTDLDTRFHEVQNTSRLSELITHAPALEYLCISSDRRDALSRLPPCPRLHTLRINCSHYHSKHVRNLLIPHTPYLPNLTHLILHAMLPSPLLAFLAAAGARLRTLEFAFAPQLVFSATQMQRLLSRCPALDELAFCVGAPEITAPAAFAHPTLRRVRLKLNPDEWYPYKHVLQTQFGVLTSEAFPALQGVVLHDVTRSLVRREVGPALLDALLRRGLKVVYDDGEVVTAASLRRPTRQNGQ
ncbi:hypothetical protein DFH06DRAFT_1479159 [Mycena polygramma]|nr:hypothetical protein DFH06DRAFT_1479159 [Mycena polygramma]